MGVGEMVNETIKATLIDGNESTPSMNYSEATKALAVAQLASCARSVTIVDAATDEKGSLSEDAVERLLGGSTSLGFNLTEEEHHTMDDAFRNQVYSSEAPSLMGIQVHSIPWWLQIVYMLGVVGALSYVIMKAVGSLSARDKEKEAAAEKKAE